MLKSEFVQIKEPLVNKTIFLILMIFPTCCFISKGRAVFEAWYFQKVKEDLNKKKAEEEAKEATRLKQIEEEAEKKEKSITEFQQWQDDKKAAYKKMLR